MTAAVLPLALVTPHGVRGRARRGRGVTLVEVLVTMALISIVAGLTMLSFGAVSGARLKRGATQIGGAVRIGYAHATATAKTVRLVFDLENQKILLEEADVPHLVRREPGGGADPVTQIEKDAAEAADQAKGPRAPRAAFAPAKAIGFPTEGKDLPPGIQLWQVETGHQDVPVVEGRAYLYFFPGGQTETAAVQLRISNADEQDVSSFMTLTVAPLTGKTRIHKGRVAMPAPRDETEASERGDPG